MKRTIKQVISCLLVLGTMSGCVGCGRRALRAKADSATPPDTPLILEEAPNEADYVTETRLTFLAAGDDVIHEAVFTDAKHRAATYVSSGGAACEYRFLDMYEGIADLVGEADLAYVNHETPVAGKAFGISGYPDFNAPEEIGNDLLHLGFNIINIANNHMLDMGEAGLRASIRYWQEKDATILGGYTKEDYDTIRYVSKDGVKVAFLSYTTFVNYAHAHDLSSGTELIIPYADEATMRRQVGLARQGGADLIFVSMHWGEEGSFTPNAEQKKYAKLLTELGVDVIIGTHSHNLQPIEWQTSPEGHKTLVIYSLGNLISTMYYSYYMVGGLMTFSIVKDETGASIEAPQLIPTVCHYSQNRDGLQIYRLEDYTAELAAAHGSQEHGRFTLATLYGYVTDTVPGEFLPSFLQ